MLQKIGQVAYKLDFPTGSLIHHVFYVRLLKKRVESKYTVSTELRRLGTERQFIVYPIAVLERKTVKRRNVAAVQWLVQWSQSIPEDASWVDTATIMEQLSRTQSLRSRII